MKSIFFSILFILLIPLSSIHGQTISASNFDSTDVHCFPAGTLITTPDGTSPIEQIKEGDIILSHNIETQAIEPAKVLSTASQHHHHLYELDFGKIKLTTTGDHPLFFQGNYYSVEPNSKYGVITNKLEKGQKIDFLEKGRIVSKKLKAIKKLKVCEDTYTITGLDKNTLFFANGVCVSVE